MFRGLLIGLISCCSWAFCNCNCYGQLITDSSQFYNNKGVDFLLKQEFNLAENQFVKALRFDKKNEIILYNLGLSLFEQGKVNAALKYYKRAYNLDKRYKNPIEGLIKCYLVLKKYKKVIKYCNRLLELNPEHYEAFYNRGVANYELKRFSCSLYDFSKASGINPFENNPLVYLGILCLRENNFVEALPYFNRALENNSDDKIALYNRGLTFLGLGNLEFACNDFTKSAALGYPVPQNIFKLCNVSNHE